MKRACSVEQALFMLIENNNSGDIDHFFWRHSFLFVKKRWFKRGDLRFRK